MPWSPTSMRSRRGPTGPSSGAPGPARSTTGSTTTRLRSWTCAPASWRDGSRPGERFRSSPSAACSRTRSWPRTGSWSCRGAPASRRSGRGWAARSRSPPPLSQPAYEHPDHGLGPLRSPVGDRGDPCHLRRAGQAAGLAGRHRGAGPGPGGRGRDPGRRGRDDHRARPRRAGRPGLRGPAYARDVAFRAGPDPRAAGGAASGRARTRLRRRHRPGHHRHVDVARHPPVRRDRLARPAADRGPAAGPRGRAPVDRHGRADARPDRQPGDVRLEGGFVGRRGPPAPRQAAGRRAALAGGPARRGRGQPGVLLRAGSSCPRPVLRRAGPGRSRHLLALVPGPGGGSRAGARVGLRHAGAHRGGGLRAAAAGDRRARRARRRGRGGQHHHAAQAQPGGERAPGHAGPAGPGAGGRDGRGDGAAARARRPRLEGRVGRAPGGLPADRGRAADRRGADRRAAGRRRGDGAQRRARRLREERAGAGAAGARAGRPPVAGAAAAGPGRRAGVGRDRGPGAGRGRPRRRAGYSRPGGRARPWRVRGDGRPGGRPGPGRPGRRATGLAMRPGSARPAAGPPAGPPAAELIAAGFELENGDAPLLHDGMNLADLAHVLDLARAGVIPAQAARRLLALLLETLRIPAGEFPYDPGYGEPYNSRERYFAGQVGDVAGWLHAGRPRREALRIAFRLRLRDGLVDLIEAAAGLAAELGTAAGAHAETLLADQTYLQHAQPSTFGHYLLSFAFPVLRECRRLDEALTWTDASPGGAGCVNGTRLRTDRANVARLLGFRAVAEHTRDAMWQTDGLVDMLAAAAGLLLTQSKLAEDLEIWASQEFDYVSLADGYSRASVLMPQKRNPYALSIIRGAAGTLIGRLTGLLAVAKTPSARSDNLIFAYGEVPRALGLALRTTELTAGVVRTLAVNSARMADVLESGFSQATDLAEFVMQECGVDYRTAYRVVGHAVREASAAGLRGADIDGALLDRAAAELTGQPLGLAGLDLSGVLDPGRIVASRTSLGGAAPEEVARMARDVSARAAALAGQARGWRETCLAAEEALVATARRCAAAASDAEFFDLAGAVPGSPGTRRSGGTYDAGS